MKKVALLLLVLFQGHFALAAATWDCGAWRSPSGSFIMGIHRVRFSADGSAATYAAAPGFRPGAKIPSVSLTNAKVSQPDSTHVNLNSNEINLEINTSQFQPYCGYIGTVSKIQFAQVGPLLTTELTSAVWCCQKSN